MRKNVKKQLALRVLSTAALMAMVSSIATAAFADTYDLNTGSVTVETKEDGFTYVTQLDNTQTDGYARNDKDDILHDYQDKTGVTITSGGEKTSNTITVETAKDQTTDVTLQDVNIQKDQWSSGSAAMTIKGEGDTEIELNGDNTLISGNRHAGLEKADDVSKGSLTIKDDLNNDNRTEKEKDEDGYSTGGDIGTLIAASGYDGAGIGGRKNEAGETDTTCTSTSDITITGGQIKAGSLNETNKEYPQTEQGGAGIGGASNYGNATNITITGNADVSAAGGYYAAGIGGGEYGNATNITISGNAKVAAAGSNSGGAGIGGGDEGVGKNIRITDHADVTAYGGNQGAGIGGGCSRGGSVEISGNAKVFAMGANGGAGIGSGEKCRSNNPELVDTSVTISENAEVTAVGSYGAAAIGTGLFCPEGKTTVTITGGTVTAIGGESDIKYGNGYCFKTLASAIGGGTSSFNPDKVQDVTVTINGTTGNTTVNASCWLDQESAISTGEGAADIIGYDKDGKSPFGEDGSVIVRMYNHGSYTTEHGSISKYGGDLTGYNLGTLYQTVHNRKYMEEHPEEIVDITKLKDEDLHDWKLVGKVVEPTTEKDGYADYICSIDKCGQTKHVVLPKLTPEPSEPDTPSTPETPDTPDTPNKPDTPKQPDGTTPAPVTPDAPAQDGTAPADTPAADTTATAQNVVQDAEPEAAAPAAAAAAVLPQTGANWLAVVGSALSGMFLLAAGFVLDRKNRRMN
ncbi:MAG: LPXTG cell wall anchor domain-containing protein [Faecalibacterium sp.]|nr:LPXTG cell wall anchor domain-containing protein [Faecalibacterium sp.]